MNRRTFLKSITAVCGAAVVCPGELLKHNPWIRLSALRKKNVAIGKRIKYKFGENMRYSIPYWIERSQYETTKT